MANLLDHAKREMDESRALTDRWESSLKQRQAAEKAWGYVCEQASLLLDIHIEGPQVHWLRKDRLRDVDRLAGSSLLRDFEWIQDKLHGECFYFGHCPREQLEAGLRLAEEFPDKLLGALRRIGRR